MILLHARRPGHTCDPETFDDAPDAYVGLAGHGGGKSAAMIASVILLVDDDPLFRRLARRVLEASGLEVAGEAGTVAEALAVAHRAPPLAALIDVGLPDGSGVELASAFATLPSPPRVVLVSTDPDAVSADAVRRSGAGAFIPKQDLPNAPLRDLLGS